MNRHSVSEGLVSEPLGVAKQSAQGGHREFRAETEGGALAGSRFHARGFHQPLERGPALLSRRGMLLGIANFLVVALTLVELIVESFARPSDRIEHGAENDKRCDHCCRTRETWRNDELAQRHRRLHCLRNVGHPNHSPRSRSANPAGLPMSVTKYPAPPHAESRRAAP